MVAATYQRRCRRRPEDRLTNPLMDDAMSFNIWQGKRVRLRAVEPHDWKIHATWDSDSNQSRAAYLIPFPSSHVAAERWAQGEATQDEKNNAFRLQIEALDSGELAGTMNSHSCDPRTGTFSYGLAIHPAHKRKGYASEAIILLLRYFFQELRYQKVTVDVYSFNIPSIKLHERLGFMPEGRQRRMVYTGGQYYDTLNYGMLVEEFREKYAEYWSANAPE